MPRRRAGADAGDRCRWAPACNFKWKDNVSQPAAVRWRGCWAGSLANDWSFSEVTLRRPISTTAMSDRFGPASALFTAVLSHGSQRHTICGTTGYPRVGVWTKLFSRRETFRSEAEAARSPPRFRTIQVRPKDLLILPVAD